jgi:uncharacterized protein YhaN
MFFDSAAAGMCRTAGEATLLENSLARSSATSYAGRDTPLPLLIDDALLSWDNSRRDRLLPALRSSSGQRQIILVSHDPTFSAWGSQIRHTEVMP